jgi:hypothetical protein
VAIERIEEDEGPDDDPELLAAIEALERRAGRPRVEKEQTSEREGCAFGVRLAY